MIAAAHLVLMLCFDRLVHMLFCLCDVIKKSCGDCEWIN